MGFARMSIRTRLTTLLVFVNALLFAAAGYAWYAIGSLNTRLTDMIEVGRRRRQEFLKRGDHPVIDQKCAPVARPGVHRLKRHRVDPNRARLNLGDRFPIVADSLEPPRGERLFRRHVQDLIFERSRAEVRNQDIHLFAAVESLAVKSRPGPRGADTRVCRVETLLDACL